MPNTKDEWGLPILPDPPEHKRPPREKDYNYWVKTLSHRVFVDSDGISLGDFCEMFQEAWTDAYAKGVRDAKR